MIDARKILALAWKVKAQTSHSLLSQLLDLVYLRLLADVKLSFNEYYDYNLFRPGEFTRSELAQFAGWRCLDWCNPRVTRWDILTTDKLVFYAYLKTLGFPIPRTVAVYTPSGRPCDSSIEMLMSTEQLTDFLSVESNLPLFAKPTRGIYGIGALLIDGSDRESGHLHVSTEGDFTVNEIVGRLADQQTMREFGEYLFQVPLTQHEALRRVAGDRISGVRMAIVNTAVGPRVFRAVLKINRGDSVSDNFKHGRSGNMLGHVDIDSGRIVRVVSGVGLELRFLDHHPSTKASFENVHIPFWAETIDCCLSLARAFYGVRLMGIDVALTPGGPVILEVNDTGDFDLLQLAAREGILKDPDVRDAILNSNRND